MTPPTKTVLGSTLVPQYTLTFSMHSLREGYGKLSTSALPSTASIEGSLS
jgi:hypothetical protein